MEKYSAAPSEVRISGEGLLAALIICMYYVKLSWQQGELPCELSEALQWEAELELPPAQPEERQTQLGSAPKSCNGPWKVQGFVPGLEGAGCTKEKWLSVPQALQGGGGATQCPTWNKVV